MRNNARTLSFLCENNLSFSEGGGEREREEREETRGLEKREEGDEEYEGEAGRRTEGGRQALRAQSAPGAKTLRVL